MGAPLRPGMNFSPKANSFSGQGSKKILVQRIALTIDALLFHHFGVEAFALLGRIGEFAKAIGQLHTTGIKLEPLRKPGIGRLGPRQRRFDPGVIGKKGEMSLPQPGFDRRRQHLGENIRPAILGRDGKSPTPGAGGEKIAIGLCVVIQHVQNFDACMNAKRIRNAQPFGRILFPLLALRAEETHTILLDFVFAYQLICAIGEVQAKRCG